MQEERRLTRRAEVEMSCSRDMLGGGGLVQRAVCGGGDAGGMWHKGGRNAVRGSADAVRDRDAAQGRDVA